MALLHMSLHHHHSMPLPRCGCLCICICICHSVILSFCLRVCVSACEWVRQFTSRPVLFRYVLQKIAHNKHAEELMGALDLAKGRGLMEGKPLEFKRGGKPTLSKLQLVDADGNVPPGPDGANMFVGPSIGGPPRSAPPASGAGVRLGTVAEDQDGDEGSGADAGAGAGAGVVTEARPSGHRLSLSRQWTASRISIVEKTVKPFFKHWQFGTGLACLVAGALCTAVRPALWLCVCVVAWCGWR